MPAAFFVLKFKTLNPQQAWSWNVVMSTSAVGLYMLVGSGAYVMITNGSTQMLSFIVQMFPMCIAVSCLCAACGWVAAHAFVRSIFKGAKYD